MRRRITITSPWLSLLPPTVPRSKIVTVLELVGGAPVPRSLANAETGHNSEPQDHNLSRDVESGGVESLRAGINASMSTLFIIEAHAAID